MKNDHVNNIRSGGFSLVEVLIAMGIFAVGFVAVAAMFPAGAILQRETVADVESQMVVRNAAAMVRTRRVVFKADGVGAHLGEKTGSGFLEPVAGISGTPASKTNDLKAAFKLGDRGYPTSQQSIIDRKYYWIPMIRRLRDPAKNKSDWIFVVFVLRRDSGADYSFTTPPVPNGKWANKSPDVAVTAEENGKMIPKVVGVPAQANGSRFTFNNRVFAETAAGQPDQVRAGDFVADQDGVVYYVTEADATGITIAGGMKQNNAATLWYAPPPKAGATSPCSRVLLLTGVVEDAN